MNLNPFDVERLREDYAKSGDKKSFLATYSESYPSIVDLNSQEEWESLLQDIPVIADPMTHDRIQKTARLLRPRAPHTTCCDIGIGNAWVEREVEKGYPNTFSWTGVDITPDNLKKLEATLRGSMYQGDILNLPTELRDKQFDYVLLLEVLEHIPHIHTFDALSAIRSLMHDTSECIISVPVFENLEEKIHDGTNYSHHVRRYTPHILLYELENAGFEVLETHELYAFSRWYRLKTLVGRYWHRWKPNVFILRARKRI